MTRNSHWRSAVAGLAVGAALGAAALIGINETAAAPKTRLGPAVERINVPCVRRSDRTTWWTCRADTGRTGWAPVVFRLRVYEDGTAKFQLVRRGRK